jgi:hypothetical protein
MLGLRRIAFLTVLCVAVTGVATLGFIANRGDAHHDDDLTVVDEVGQKVLDLAPCEPLPVVASPGSEDTAPTATPPPTPTAVAAEGSPPAAGTPGYHKGFGIKGSPAGMGELAVNYLRLSSVTLAPKGEVPMECIEGYFLIYVEHGSVELAVGPDATGLVKVNAAKEMCFDCLLAPGDTVELVPGDAVFFQDATISITNMSDDTAATILVASIGVEDLPCGAVFC